MWKSADSPGVIFDPFESRSYRMMEFIRKRTWLQMGDRMLILYCVGFFIFEIAMIVTFIAAILI